MEEEAKVTGTVLQAYFEPDPQDAAQAELVVVRKTGCQVFTVQFPGSVAKKLELPRANVTMATRRPGSDVFYLATEGSTIVEVVAEGGQAVDVGGVPSGLWATERHLVVACEISEGRHLVKVYSLAHPQEPTLCLDTQVPQKPCLAVRQTQSGSLLALPARAGIRLVEVVELNGSTVFKDRDLELTTGPCEFHAFNRDASTLATTHCCGRGVVLWTVPSTKDGLEPQVAFYRGYEEAAFRGVVFDQNSSLLACVSSRPTCHVFDLSPDTLQQEKASEEESILSRALAVAKTFLANIQDLLRKGNPNLPTSKYKVDPKSTDREYVACCLGEESGQAHLALVSSDARLTIYQLLEEEHEHLHTFPLDRKLPSHRDSEPLHGRDEAGREGDGNVDGESDFVSLPSLESIHNDVESDNIDNNEFDTS